MIDTYPAAAIASTIAAAPVLPLILHARVVTGRGGGPDKTILNSPRFLPAWGYQAHCAYMHPAGDVGFPAIEKRAKDCGAPLFAVKDRGPIDLTVFRALLQYCRQHDVAIWHGHDYKSNLIGVWVRRYWPMKLVTTVHGWVEHTWKTPLYYAIDRYTLPRYDKVICVSDDLRQTCLRSGVRKDRCVLIENAIDTEQFQRRCSTVVAKAKLGFPTDGLLIGAVGRLSAEKGFDILLQAVDRLLKQNRNVHLVIAGEGNERESLQRQMDELGLGGRVKLLGFRADTIELFQAFDIFALSSLREGLPNVILEAMAMEVPIVATAIAGIPKVIESGTSGLLIPPSDVTALEAALRQLVDDLPLRNAFAQAARQTIEARFSFARRMHKIAAVYDEVLT